MESIILEINLKNIFLNYLKLKEKNANGITAAVVKANAYGLGIKKILPILIKAGCNDFYVATIKEAIEIRKINKKINIYVLNGIDKNEIKYFINNNIIPVINNLNEFRIVYNIKKKFSVLLHYDTGMNRLGLNFDEIKLISKKLNLRNINIKYIISHLASSEEMNNSFNNFQLKKFMEISHLFRNISKSIANSSGIYLKKEFILDMTRPGISIYGGYGNIKIKKSIRPVIKLKSKVLQIKKVSMNQTIGYNQTYKCKKELYIATIAIGYGDGMPRILSNIGHVHFRDFKAKIVGRISMDTLMVDISKFYKKIKVGNYVEIINEKTDIEKFAKLSGTVSQDILTSIGKRTKFVYIK